MIDAHVHVWTLDPERYPWQPVLPGVTIPGEPATVEDLLDSMDAAQVEKAVLVQPSQYGWDNSYLCDCMDRYPGRFAGVCLVNPHSPDAVNQLRYWCIERGCGGFRLNLIAESDISWLLAPGTDILWQAVRELDIPVLFQLFPHQAHAVGALASAYPELTLVIDNLGPHMFSDPGSIDAVTALASHPNILFKLIPAGVESTEPYPFRDLWTLTQHIVERSGSTRLLFGTDFPYGRRGCTYLRAIQWPDLLPFLPSQKGVFDNQATRLFFNI